MRGKFRQGLPSLELDLDPRCGLENAMSRRAWAVSSLIRSVSDRYFDARPGSRDRNATSQGHHKIYSGVNLPEE